MLLAGLVSGQNSLDRFEILAQKLEAYSEDFPNIDKEIDISITGTLSEFAVSFSRETKINLIIDPSLKIDIVSNFSDTRPRDILLYLCRFYNLDLNFSGSIIGLIPFDAPPVEQTSKPLDISYNNYNNQIKLDLKNDTLDLVVKKISELTNINIITTPPSSNLLVSGYIGNTALETALEQLGKRNNIEFTKNDKGYYVFDIAKKQTGNSKTAASTEIKPNNRRSKTRRTNIKSNAEDLIIRSKENPDGSKSLSIEAIEVPLSEIIKSASLESGASYFLFSEPTEAVSLNLEDVSFEEFLDNALRGVGFSYKNDNGLLLIGDAKSGQLRETRVVQMQHRTVKDLSQFIPKEFVEEVNFQEFLQLNALILSGPEPAMDKMEEFIRDIDKSVPVVMIELLIIDVNNSKELNAGVELGLGSEPSTSGGLIYPETGFTFGANAINRLLGTLAGNGIVNLGRVRPNFYASLQAVENNGLVKVRSKPRLSTLNGMEANLSLGETRYFLNERTTLQGNQNPISLQDRRFEAVNADFSIRIVPIVSGDEYVTLEIEVNQSDFIGRIQTNAPPPQVNRNFNSNIRIHNQEMIVLGGLESKTIEDSGRGVPFLARIPVIKWLFSKRRKARNKSKLLVFVRPTVIY